MPHIRVQYQCTWDGQTAFLYTIRTPKIVIQQTGEHRLLGIEHVDGTYHVPAYFVTRDGARTVAKTLAEQYATADLPTVTDYVKLANDVVEQYAELTTAGRKETP